ncbi:MAG: hypothetical protein RIK87_27440 [Fuerstiella sp.]
MNDEQPSNSLNPDRSSASDIPGAVIVLAAAALMIYAVMNSRPLQSANDRSRWCTVWSLVERGTYQIDEIDRVRHWSTIDKVRHRSADDQPYHFYSSKPPLFPTMVAGLYWLEKQTLGYDLFNQTTMVTRLLLLVINALPMFFALLALRKSLRRLAISGRTRWFVLTAAGFASMLNPFLTTLNNHTPAAASLMFSLAAMLRISQDAVPRRRDFAVAGFTAALTCCFELPAALFGILSFVVLTWTDWKQTARAYVPAALIPLAAFFVTNWICTGGIKPFYTYYGTEKYVYVHEGVPSYWSEPQGIDANQESTPVYLFHCVLGHHGLLSMTPIYLLTLAGWWISFRWRRPDGLLSIQLPGSGITMAVLIFYLTRTENYNYGGNSSTLRWMLWLIPFWWYGMIPAVDRLVNSRTGLLMLLVLLVPSVYSPLYSLTRPWKPGWVYVQMERAGWIDYRTRIPPFDPPRRAVITKLPDDAGVINTFRGSQGAADQLLTLESGRLVAVGETRARELYISVQNADSAVKQRVSALVLTETLKAGEDIQLWLRVVPDGVSADQLTSVQQLRPAPTWAVEKLRGLPQSRAYNSASHRYLKYTRDDGEKSAVKCDRGASRVSFEHPEFGKCWQRCDVYYCDQLPFGVAEWRITVTAGSTNKVVHSEMWTCRELP